MLHLPPREILKVKHELIVEHPRLFIPGVSPAPKLIGAQREISPGSQSWATPGTYYWSVPLFNNLYITVKGAGGGGSGAAYMTPDYYDFWLGGEHYTGGTLYTGGAGATGGYGQWYIPNFVNMVAYGGSGGPGGSTRNTTSPMPRGAHGQGYNGNTANYNGSGTSGGAYGYAYSTQQATKNPDQWGSGMRYGGYGGNGGRCDSHYTLGQIPMDTVVTIVIQAGGGAGWQYTNSGGAYPVAGGVASVSVTWN